MIIVVVKGYEDNKVLAKLAAKYPDISWLSVNIPPYDDPMRRLGVLNDFVNCFSTFLFLGQWKYKEEANIICALCYAKSRTVYTENDYPIDDPEEKKESEDIKNDAI